MHTAWPRWKSEEAVTINSQLDFYHSFQVTAEQQIVHPVFHS